MQNASKQIGDFGMKAMKYGAIAGGDIATWLAAGTIRTLDQIDALGDLSNQTGVAVGDMMVLQRAYKDGGREADMAGKDIGKMQKALVDASIGGKDPFSAIGLSAKELMSLNPAEQFSQIGEAIMRIEDPAERTAKAMEIFGKGGMGLTTVFPGIKDAEKSLGKMPALAQQFAGAMGQANDLIGHLPVKSDQFFVGFTAGIVGELLPGLQKIDDYDFTTLGQNIGTSLSVAFEMLTDGSVWEIFKLKGEAAIATLGSSPAINGFHATLNAIWDGITDGGNFDFDAAFNRYAEAGMAANIEIIDAAEARIDEILNRAKGKVSAKTNAATGSGSSAQIGSALTDIFQPEIKAGRSPSPATMPTNEYQRRGLATGGERLKLETPTDKRQLEVALRSFSALEQIAKNTALTADGEF